MVESVYQEHNWGRLRLNLGLLKIKYLIKKKYIFNIVLK
jgi:hypothetical protein